MPSKDYVPELLKRIMDEKAPRLFDSSRLYEALKNQDLLPQMSKEPGLRGTYAYTPAYNLLNAPDERGTLTHEMAHAVNQNVLEATAFALHKKKRIEHEDLTKQEQQFLDAFNKLTGNDYGISIYDGDTRKKMSEGQQKLVKELYFDQLPKDYEPDNWDKYRTSYKELQGWGVGNTSVREKQKYGAPSSVQHLDPSITTEFDILLTMFDQLPNEVKKASADMRKKDIEASREKYKEGFDKRKRSSKYEDILADPFANPLLK